MLRGSLRSLEESDIELALLVAAVLLLVVAGVAAKMWLLRSADSAGAAPVGLSGEVLDQAVVLALEMSRCDGAIHETELAAIQQRLQEMVAGLDDQAADQLVNRVLKATMKEGRISNVVGRLASTSEHDRQAIMAMLTHVAEADGELQPEERTFLEEVGARLGV